jgi:preprotein translocase subunit SecA
LVHQFVPPESVEEQWDIASLQQALTAEWRLEIDLAAQIAAASSITDEDVLAAVVSAAHAAFEEKLALVGAESFTHFERMVLLQTIDSQWRDHLSSLDYLRQGIHLRGYAQKQPKQEYKREAFELFGQMLDSVKNEVTKTLMTVRIQSAEQIDEAALALESRAENISNITYTAPTETGEVQVTQAASAPSAAARPDLPRVGRNEPCPCGNGKKYKHCHGKLA